MNMFPGYSWMDMQQSRYPWSPHPHQNRGHFLPPRKTARSHFVFKLLASERLCVEIIKAKCVGKEPNHQSSTTNTGSEGCGDGARACTDVSAGMGALITRQGTGTWAPLGGPAGTWPWNWDQWVYFLVLYFMHQAGFRKREVGLDSQIYHILKGANVLPWGGYNHSSECRFPNSVATSKEEFTWSGKL